MRQTNKQEKKKLQNRYNQQINIRTQWVVGILLKKNFWNDHDFNLVLCQQYKSSDNALQSDIIYEVWETVFVKKYILIKENYS